MEEQGGEVEATDSFVVDEYAAVPEDDVTAIKALFLDAFPLRYGEYFYDSLRKGFYGGRPLLTCVARKDGQVIGAACATKEDETFDSTRMLESGSRTYLMTLAVLPR